MNEELIKELNQLKDILTKIGLKMDFNYVLKDVDQKPLGHCFNYAEELINKLKSNEQHHN